MASERLPRPASSRVVWANELRGHIAVLSAETEVCRAVLPVDIPEKIARILLAIRMLEPTDTARIANLTLLSDSAVRSSLRRWIEAGGGGKYLIHDRNGYHLTARGMRLADEISAAAAAIRARITA